MMEFVRTAIKNKRVRVIGGVGLSLLLASLLIYFWPKKAPNYPAGRLKAVENLTVEGANGLKAVTAGPDGSLYLADSRNNRIVVLDEDGDQDQVIDNEALKGKTKMVNPLALAVGQDKLYVGNYGSKQILVFDLDGDLIDVLPHSNEQEQFRTIAPLALTTDQAGNLYAADGEKHRISIFDQQGKLKLVFGSEGYAADKFRHINGLVVDEKNQRLLIQDSGNLRIVFTTLEGKFLSQVSFSEKGQNLFTAPRGLEYDDRTGLIYLADAVSDHVFALTEEGTVQARGKEQLSYPQALVLGQDGFLYVVNRENQKLIKMNP